MIITVSGACRKNELKDMQTHHITDICYELYNKVEKNIANNFRII